MEEKKLLTLEDVLAGIEPIVQADPLFVYPQQEHDYSEERCLCVEVEQDENEDYLEEHFLYEDCPWHLDDDNTCRYVKEDNSPACVVGHYFVKELGFDDLYNFETKAPTFILEAHGYEVEILPNASSTPFSHNRTKVGNGNKPMTKRSKMLRGR